MSARTIGESLPFHHPSPCVQSDPSAEGRKEKRHGRREGGRESAAEEGKNGQHTITIVLLSVCPALPLFSFPRCKRGEISRREATDSPSRERERVGEKEEAREGRKLDFTQCSFSRMEEERAADSAAHVTASLHSPPPPRNTYGLQKEVEIEGRTGTRCVCVVRTIQNLARNLPLCHPSKRFPRSRKLPKSFPQGKRTIKETFIVCRPSRAFVHRTHVGRSGMRRPFFLG